MIPSAAAGELLHRCKRRPSAPGQQQMGLSCAAEAVEAMASAPYLDSPISLPLMCRMSHGKATTMSFASRSASAPDARKGCRLLLHIIGVLTKWYVM